MKLKFGKILFCTAVMAFLMSGCADSSLSSGVPNNDDVSNTQQVTVSQVDTGYVTEENLMKKMTLQIGNNNFTATLENNVAVDGFVEMMSAAPVIIQMNDYSGFEKVGSLGMSLPVDDSRITTHAGDIVLYNGNQIVIFYGSNSWSYTRLGKIEDLSGWEDALGSGDVTVTFSLEQ